MENGFDVKELAKKGGQVLADAAVILAAKMC